MASPGGRGEGAGLGDGKEVNQAIAAHTCPLPELEKKFAAFAKDKADNLAPGVDLEKQPAKQSELDAKIWETAHSQNYFTRLDEAQKLMDAKKWAEARPVLESLAQAYSGERRAENPMWLLAAVGLELGSCLGYVIVFRRFFPEPPQRVGRQVAWIAMGASAVLPGGNLSSPASIGWLLRHHGIGARRLVEMRAQERIVAVDISRAVGAAEEVEERGMVGQALQAADFQPVERDMRAVEIDGDDLGGIGDQVRKHVAAARGDRGDPVGRSEPQRLHVDDRILPDLRVYEIAKREREQPFLNSAA